MTDPLQTLLDHAAIEQILTNYAKACDARAWQKLESVFTPDVSVNYGGEFKLEGRDSVVGMITSMLGGCGPTQHLLGNFDIAVDGDSARCQCYVRAIHAGLATEADTLYEVWAEYHDELVKTAQGWRIRARHMIVHKEVGSREILQPAP